MLMAEPKPIASLSSGLLARKGAARPAMRRQGLVNVAHELDDFKGHDDLGWNDMGYDVDPPKADRDHGGQASFHHGSLMAGAIPPIAPESAMDAAYGSDDTDETGDTGDTGETGETGEEAAVQAIEGHDVLQEDEILEETSQSCEPPMVVRQRDALAQSFSSEPREPESESEDASDAADIISETNVTELNPAAHQVLSIKPARKNAEPVKERLAVVSKSQAIKIADARNAKGKRAAFTLRIDSARHLRLRLASAVTGRSAQQLITEALDELLTKIPEIESMADRVSQSSGR